MNEYRQTVYENTDTSYTQNRELSWLRFNARVLEEAQDTDVPLYERLKFISIFESNLDEFFMVRVGSLTDRALRGQDSRDNKTGWSTARQLREIFRAAEPLYRERDRAFAEIEHGLEEQGVVRQYPEKLSETDRKLAEKYMRRLVLPVVSPQIIEARQRLPHLINNENYIVLCLRAGETDLLGLLPLPPQIPPVVFLRGKGTRYMLTEDLLCAYADLIFPGYAVMERAVIKVTRNADISWSRTGRDTEEDYRKYIGKRLRQRAWLAPVRLEVRGQLPTRVTGHLRRALHLGKKQVFISKAPLKTGYVFALGDKLRAAPEMSYPPFVPQPCAMADETRPMLSQVRARDILLHYPYESMEPFLRLMREAAQDSAVTDIRITVYRLARVSKLASYLMAAAENGIQVTVLMELRARFDEENNIAWAERLEQAGCTVIYGLERYKVHSKVCLVTRHTRGKTEYITQIGTGNYNEKTAAQYTDLCLMTADPAIGRDAHAFFENMCAQNLRGSYRQLLVAPFGLKAGVLRMIDEQRDRARKGAPAGIFLKLNSLTDRDIISALSEASCAGVPVRLLIRGICCLLPGIPGKTENIAVRSIVGRFLEHPRVYCFGQGREAQLYLSSADLMTRNTVRRVEVACPVHDPAVRRIIMDILEVQWSDTVKARALLPDGRYVPCRGKGPAVHAQKVFMEQAMKGAKGERGKDKKAAARRRLDAKLKEK